MIRLVTPLLTSLGFGFVFVCMLWPGGRRLLRDLPLVIFLSVGLGFGISSLLFFLWLLAFGQASSAFAAFEIPLLLIFSVFVVLFRRRGARPASLVSETVQARHAGPKLEWIAAVVFLAALLAAIRGFMWFEHGDLNGGWDAWGIWNLRAKFLFLGGSYWRDAFSAEGSLSHTDYPLLIPASVARAWSYVGSDIPQVPILIGAMFTAATAGLLLSSLSILRSRSQGLLAATVLLATPFFIVLGTAQYADVPLGFFMLSTLVLLCLHESVAEEGGSMLVLAGTSAGLAAWTKNEGVLFLVCLLLGHLSLAPGRRNLRPHLQKLLPFVAGLAPVLLVVAYFKLHFAGHNDLFSSLTAGLKMLGRIARWRVVTRAFAHQLLHFGGWVAPVTPFLALYILLVGVAKPMSNSLKICLRALSLTALGYFFVYIVAPVPLDWLLETSLNRVLAQLWPSTLFLVFVATNTFHQEREKPPGNC